MISRFTLLLSALVLVANPAWAQEIILEDGGVGMGREEVEAAVSLWTPDMKTAAAADYGDMVELLNRILVSKKMALAARDLEPLGDPDIYWETVFRMRDQLQKIMLDYYGQNVDVPDMTDLAKEQYQANPEKLAAVPATRISSHILVGCTGTCPHDEKQALAEDIRERLLAGEDFEALVAEYSDDVGSKDKGGKFDRWLRFGERDVVKPYVAALFKIEKEGDLSPVTRSKFGYHIIRLDGVRESQILPFEEVREKIVANLQKEYRLQAVRAYLRSFNISDDAYIDQSAMEEIIAPYRTSAAQ